MNNLLCSVCELSLPKESFSIDSSCKRGYQYKCKACRSIYNKVNAERYAEQQKLRNRFNVEHRRTRSKNYERANKEKLRLARKLTRQQNIEKYKAYQKSDKVKRIAKEYKIKHKEAIKEIQRKYRKENRAKLTYISNLRKKQIKAATPKWLNKKHRQEMLEYYIICKELDWLSNEPLQVDHIVPIKGEIVCGLNVPWNLQVLPRNENIKKSNRYE